MNQPDITTIAQTTALAFNLELSDILGRDRTKRCAKPRMVAMAIARTITPISLGQIGSRFKRDHSTVLHAVDAVMAEPKLRDAAAFIAHFLSCGEPSSLRTRFRAEMDAARAIGEALTNLLGEGREIEQPVALARNGAELEGAVAG